MRRRPGLRKRRSGEVACRRLKLLLTADKTGCSPELLEMLKRDMCRVISKYMEINSEEMELRIHRLSFPGTRDTIPALYADIPIRSLNYKGTF